MRKLLVAFLVSCAFGAFANEWYVDPTNGVDTAAGTQDAPRKTLKGAMEVPDLASGDTIWLLPGEYAEESMAEGGTRRLYLDGTKTNLKFRSIAGRDKTAIVGVRDGDNGHDGPNAMGCVWIAPDAKDCVFEGITFRDGATRSTSDDLSGGGLRDQSKSCWVIGCRFTNCVVKSVGGAMHQGNAAATEFVDCRSASGSSSFGYNLGKVEFCLFRTEKYSADFCDYGGTYVNCTFYSGKSKVAFHRGIFNLYNCLSFGFATSCGEDADGTNDKAENVQLHNTCLGVCLNATPVANSATNVNEAEVRFVAPAAGDLRLTDISVVKELGDAAHLALSPFPEGFVRRDVYGNPVTATSGAIPAGCALEVPHQTGGRVDFDAAFEVRELGCSFAANDYFNPIREDYTYMFRPVTDKQVHSVYGIFGKELNSKGAWIDIKEYFFPLRKNGNWVPVGVRPEICSTNRFAVFTAAKVYYADPVDGNDDYDGLSSNVVDAAADKGPFRTLMGAMAKIDNSATGTSILYLMPGTYAEGCTETRPGNGTDNTPYGVRYRVYVGVANLAIVGLEGAGKTFIVGAPHSDTQALGPDAIGGVWLKSGTDRYVQGVTITGCHSTDTESTAYTAVGCAFSGGGSDSTYAIDCVISNNTAYAAPAQSYGRLIRCRVLENRSTRHLSMRGGCYSCLFAGNVMTSASRNFADNATYGCTFDAELGGECGSAAWYSLVLNGESSDRHRESCVDNVPLVTDDYRLGSLSPAVLFGDLAVRPVDSTYRLTCDVDGNKLEIRDGRMTVGAVHGGPRPACVAINGNGGSLTVEGGEEGTRFVTSEEPVTVTASASRPFLRFELNGVAQPDGQTRISFTPSAEPDAATCLTAIYGTNWYVDVANGSDAALGATPLTARQTIRSVTTNAVSGDVIHVAPGAYGALEGTSLASGGGDLPCRVILPAGVTLVADEGAEKTFIVGAGGADESAEANYGNGPDAVRCVYAGKGATIRGFTLTGGHSLTEGSTADLRGSAVYSADVTTRLVDCVVSNNAVHFGTLMNCRVVRGRILGNKSSVGWDADGNPLASAVVGDGCGWYGCIIDDNCGGSAIRSAKGIYSCTLGDGNHAFKANGARVSTQQILYIPKEIHNTIILAGSTYKDTWATNCLILAGTKTVSTSDTYLQPALAGHSIVTNKAWMALGGDYAPVFGSNAGIDAGDASFVPVWAEEFAETDICGNPRVSNGKMDIGAVEYDWRGRYRDDLGRRVRSVDEASPEVVETDRGTVRIPSGTLVGTLRPGDVQLNFTVTGGTLAVWLGETLVGEFTALPGPQSVKLEPTEANNEFRLAFTPTAADGCAEIARLKGLSGLLLLAR